MPEEQPLQTLVALELIGEAEAVLLVGELEQVEELGRGLHDGEGRRLRVVDEDGDAAVGVEAEEPFFLLLVGHDVEGGGGPAGGGVGEQELFEEDLHFLAVGGGHGDEVEALGRVMERKGGGGIGGCGSVGLGGDGRKGKGRLCSLPLHFLPRPGSRRCRACLPW